MAPLTAEQLARREYNQKMSVVALADGNGTLHPKYIVKKYADGDLELAPRNPENGFQLPNLNNLGGEIWFRDEANTDVTVRAKKVQLGEYYYPLIFVSAFNRILTMKAGQLRNGVCVVVPVPECDKNELVTVDFRVVGNRRWSQLTALIRSGNQQSPVDFRINYPSEIIALWNKCRIESKKNLVFN